MRDDLNELAVYVANSGGAIALVCAARGANSDECTHLRALHEGAKLAHRAARAAVDLYDASGVAVGEADAALAYLHGKARAFALASDELGRRAHGDVARLVDQHRNTSGAPSGEAPAGAAPSAAQEPSNGGARPSGLLPLGLPP